MNAVSVSEGPDYWFFLSYARADKDEYLEKFYSDLAQSVSISAGLGRVPLAQVGFRDSATIEPGDDWPGRLGQALQRSRVLVALYSPNYFNSAYCGKEWAVFQRRRELLADPLTADALPPVIIPVIWMPPRERTPEAVTSIQWSHAAFGDTYAAEGAQYLLRLKSQRDAYQEFLTRLRDRVVDVANKYHVPPLQQLPPLAELRSAWGQAISTRTFQRLVPGLGPREVGFVFAVGRRDELQSVRTTYDQYGEEGGRDWRAYAPDLKDEIGILAQDVVSREKLFFDVVSIGPDPADLVARVLEAEQANKILVVVIDPWTLKLSQYRRILEEYDRRDSQHSVVVVPWNLGDPETLDRMGELEALISDALAIKSRSGDPLKFHEPGSAGEFKRDLQRMLAKVRSRIISAGQPRRLIRPGRFSTKPTITGPVGLST